MKIAQIAPLYESVPPRLYGGTERVVSYLTEELVRQGHDVTLFASGDSKTSAKLVPCSDLALRMNPAVIDPVPYHIIMLEEVRRKANEFDILHFHIDFLHAPLVHHFTQRTLTTLHGRLDLPHIVPFYRFFRELPLVAVSDDQRNYLRSVNWAGTVHHGLPRDLLPLQPKVSGGYLAFLGRISPEKRPDHAIEIAARTGKPLKIAAKVDRADQLYWQEKIRPIVEAHANVEFVGEIAEREKARFLGQAAALLFHEIGGVGGRSAARARGRCGPDVMIREGQNSVGAKRPASRQPRGQGPRNHPHRDWGVLADGGIATAGPSRGAQAP